MSFFEKILEYIFLPTCGICGKLEKDYLCEKCGNELSRYMIIGKENIDILHNVENKSTKNINNDEFSNLNNKVKKMHIFEYKETIRKLILQYKFNDKSYLYKTFSEIIVKNKKAFDFIKSYDIIIPVPIHKTRMRERGYNQSELIAKELAKKARIKFYEDVLIKVKNNKVQSTLCAEEREKNTKNVYKLINLQKIYNKKILIFDDIYTTGATVNSCIREIKKGKPSQIAVLTLAKD